MWVLTQGSRKVNDKQKNNQKPNQSKPKHDAFEIQVEFSGLWLVGVLEFSLEHVADRDNLELPLL